MNTISIIKRSAICLCGVVTSLLASDPSQIKIYDLPKAMVRYTISGGGVLSDDVNMTLKGEGKLRFREWGAVELVEMQIEEKTVGSLHYRMQKRTCEKRQKKQILDVDFENKKIRERPLPLGKRRTDPTEGLVRSGQQMVANVVCDMWEGVGIRKCLYKKIPLFTEYHALGLFYREEAREVYFDINATEHSACNVPSYPVEKFSLYTTNFKTKNNKLPREFSKRLLKIIEQIKAKGGDEEKLSEKERRVLINMIGEPLFQSQKHLLPKLLETLKRTRACLVQAEKTTVANACLYDLIQMKSYFTGNSHNTIENWEHEREVILDTFDENIVVLQSKMKCIRGAKHFSDLAACMRP